MDGCYHTADAFENTLLVRLSLYSSQQGGLQWIVKHWLRDMCYKWLGPHTLSSWLANQDCRDLISNQAPLKTKGPSFYSAFLPHPPHRDSLLPLFISKAAFPMPVMHLLRSCVDLDCLLEITV